MDSLSHKRLSPNRDRLSPPISPQLIALLPEHCAEIKSVSISILALSPCLAPAARGCLRGCTCLALSNPPRISVVSVFLQVWRNSILMACKCMSTAQCLLRQQQTSRAKTFFDEWKLGSNNMDLKNDLTILLNSSPGWIWTNAGLNVKYLLFYFRSDIRAHCGIHRFKKKPSVNPAAEIDGTTSIWKGQMKTLPV